MQYLSHSVPTLWLPLPSLVTTTGGFSLKAGRVCSGYVHGFFFSPTFSGEDVTQWGLRFLKSTLALGTVQAYSNILCNSKQSYILKSYISGWFELFLSVQNVHSTTCENSKRSMPRAPWSPFEVDCISHLTSRYYFEQHPLWWLSFGGPRWFHQPWFVRLGAGSHYSNDSCLCSVL